MSDTERELVGTCYKNAGQEAAIALGRQLVTEDLQQQRTAAWLAFSKANPEGYLYCFRGGLRSRISQQWMHENGVNYPFIEGGYKAMRRFLIDQLESSIESVPITLISGRTGCGKTRLLTQLTHTIDLEKLANHRGSSFGATGSSQPTLINFENAISTAFLKHRHHHSGCVYLEDESHLIGSLALPISLKNKMAQAPHIELETPLELRIDYAIEDYIVCLLASYQQQYSYEVAFELLSQRHLQSLSNIRKRLGPERHQQAQTLLTKGLNTHRETQSTKGYRGFIELILSQYYDPMYDYQLSTKGHRGSFKGNSAEVKQYIAQYK
jgi:tRNA 2-selenouridine synthase